MKLSDLHSHYRPSSLLFKFKNMNMRKRHCTDWYYICDLWSLLPLTVMMKTDPISKTLVFLLNIDVADCQEDFSASIHSELFKSYVLMC